MYKPLRVFYHPVGIKTGVIGYHIAGQPYAARGGPCFQVFIGGITAQVGGNFIILQGIGGGDRFRVTVYLFYLLRGIAAFPQTDQPQTGDAEVGQAVQLFIGNLIQTVYLPAVVAA